MNSMTLVTNRLKEPESHTVCFLFDKYGISESKINTARSTYVETNAEKLLCIYPLNENSGFQLNIEYPHMDGPKKTIYLLKNTKVKSVQKLVMVLQPYFGESVEPDQAPTKFVRLQLNNPNAKVTGCVTFLEEESPNFLLF